VASGRRRPLLTLGLRRWSSVGPVATKPASVAEFGEVSDGTARRAPSNGRCLRVELGPSALANVPARTERDLAREVDVFGDLGLEVEVEGSVDLRAVGVGGARSSEGFGPGWAGAPTHELAMVAQVGGDGPRGLGRCSPIARWGGGSRPLMAPGRQEPSGLGHPSYW